MHLEDRIKNGMTFYEHGHTDPIDIEQEKELEAQRRHCKEVMFDYNNTRPSENVKKKEILKGILGHCTERVFIESPVHMSYGNHVHLGDQFYANFNLVIIDDLLLLPAYGKAFGMPVDTFVEMGAAIIPAIHSLTTFCLFSVAPFNIIKGIVVSLITLVLYKHISRLLKGSQA